MTARGLCRMKLFPFVADISDKNYIFFVYVRAFSFSTILEYVDERGSHHWSEERFNNVIRLRQEALDEARAMKVDYLMVNVLSLPPFPSSFPPFIPV